MLDAIVLVICPQGWKRLFRQSDEIIVYYNIGSVIGGGNNIGGIAGKFEYSDDEEVMYTSSGIESCYNTRNVLGAAAYSTGGIVGGETNSTITDCFYTTASTMISESIISTLNTAAGGSYWGFDTDNRDDGYPILLAIDYE